MCEELAQSEIKVLIKCRLGQIMTQKNTYWGEGERTMISQSGSIRKMSHRFPKAAYSEKLLLVLFSNYAVLIHITTPHFLPI